MSYPGDQPVLKNDFVPNQQRAAQGHTDNENDQSTAIMEIAAALGDDPVNPPVDAPAASAATVAELLGQIKQALEDIKGTANWYDAAGASIVGINSDISDIEADVAAVEAGLTSTDSDVSDLTTLTGLAINPDGTIKTDKVVKDSVDFDDGIWWEEVGRLTVNSPGSFFSLTGITPKKYLRIILYSIYSSGTINAYIRFNGDSGNNYAVVNSTTFAASATSTSANLLNIDPGTPTTDCYMVMDIVNLATKQKIGIAETICANGAASAAPTSLKSYSKWVNTSDQINRIDLGNQTTGDFAAGTEIIVLGHD